MNNRPTQTTDHSVEAQRRRMVADHYHADSPTGNACRAIVNNLSEGTNHLRAGENTAGMNRFQAARKAIDNLLRELLTNQKLTLASSVSELFADQYGVEENSKGDRVVSILDSAGVKTIGDIEIKGNLGIRVIPGIGADLFFLLEQRLHKHGFNFWRFG